MALQWQNKHASLLALGGVAALGLYLWASWKPELPLPAAARAPTAGGVSSVPGGRQTPEYARLQQLADEARANRAREIGDSSVPTPPELHAVPSPRVPSPAPSPPPVTVIPPPPPATPTPAPDDTGELMNRFDSAMRAQMKSLLDYRTRFEPTPTRMVTFEDIKGQRAQAVAQKHAEEREKDVHAARPRDRYGVLQPGNILFAVLQTAINSDEPGPVRARIVGERFKDAILLGTLSPFPPVVGSRPERVVVKFHSLTTSDQITYAIDAYAIDTDTARTALASEVNHHALERWGSLMAASFLEGYGNAIRNTHRITSVGVFGNVVSVPKDDLSHSDIAREALGTVGQRLGGAVAENFQRPNTITVAPGTGLGILMVSPAVRVDADGWVSKMSLTREPTGVGGGEYRPLSGPVDPESAPASLPAAASHSPQTAHRSDETPIMAGQPPPVSSPSLTPAPDDDAAGAH